MATNPVDGWRKIAIEKLENSRLVTDYRGLSESEIPYEEFPNYGVFECNPDTTLNENNYLISGTEPQIMLQSSLIKALYRMLGHQLGYTIDFDLWFKDFELEFKLDPITGASRIPIVTDQEIAEFTFWGRAKDERPKFEYLDVKTNADRKKKARGEPSTLGYRVIKFWKNRKQLESFDILAGTPTELRSQIFYLMYAGSGEIAESDDIGGKGISESRLLSGWPEIKIKFYQVNPVEGSKVRYDSEFGITLIGYGEAVEDNELKTLDIADLKRFKTKIEEIFYPGGIAHTIQRGLEVWTYQDWKKGYACWCKFRNQETAISLYQKLVQIKGDTFDPDIVKIGEPFNKEQYRTTKKITVLGKEESKRNLRPIVDLEFWQAWVWLPKSCQKIMLVSRSRRNPADPRLL